MKVLVGLRGLLHSVGITEQDRTSWKYIVIVFVQVVITSLSVVAIMWHLLFDAGTFIDSTEAFYYGCAISGILNTYIDLLCNQTEMYRVITTLESKVNERGSHRDLYEACNRKIKNWSHLAHEIFLKRLLFVYYLAPYIVSYFNYFILEKASESFLLNLPAAFPFEWRAPIPYFIAATIQLLVGLKISAVYILMILAFVSFCVLLVAFSSDLEEELRTIELGNLQLFNSKRVCLTDRRIAMKKRLFDFIQFHADITQSIHDCSKVCESSVNTLFFICVSTVCIQLLILLTAMNTTDAVMIAKSLIIGVLVMTPCLFICNFGENVSNRFISLSDSIYDLSWHHCPMDEQKLIPFMLMIAQKPVHMRGFANLKCSREIFKKIVNTGFSTFTILRRFD